MEVNGYVRGLYRLHPVRITKSFVAAGCKTQGSPGFIGTKDLLKNDPNINPGNLINQLAILLSLEIGLSGFSDD